MTYADAGRRRDLITGLRALAKFLEDSPLIPAPYCVDVLVFPPGALEEDGRAEIDRIAVLTGARIDDQTAEYGHYTASRVFGPVEYRAVFIPPAPAPITTRGARIPAASFPDRTRRCER